MHHRMSDPCDNCPFRTDLPHGYLRPDRIREIAESLFRGESFPCHKTTETVEDDEGFGDRVATEDSLQCAGAEIFLAKQGLSTQMGRIAERLGMAQPLNMEAPVSGSVSQMLKVHRRGSDEDTDEDEEIETCAVVIDGCEAPAGIMVGGGVIEGTEAAEFQCHDCGEPVCGNCSEERDGVRICYYCAENEDE